MPKLGYWLSSEEHSPSYLVRYAQRAEEVGFSYAQISDHFHPWIDRQGQSPFVWSVLGGIASATTRLELGTGVTCPTVRIHPAIIAQAAATTAAMMPGRFFLGVGSGEFLNEHIFGDPWPPVAVRQEMLTEAIEVIRTLWQGGLHSFYGEFYTVENARLYTLPDQLPHIYVAASGKESAALAGQIGDGLIGTSPQKEVVQTFEEAGGSGKPRYGQLSVCWAPEEQEARHLAYQIWPTSGLKGPLGTELAIPQYFEEAVQMVTEEQIGQEIVCGPDPERYLQAIQEFIDAGFDHIALHQIGPAQEAFFDFCKRSILPEFPQE